MRFIQVTSSKYISNTKFSLRRCRDGRFSIFCSGKVTEWGQGFKTVKSAENFLNKHDCNSATETILPISVLDLEYIYEMYVDRAVSDKEWIINPTAKLLLAYNKDSDNVIVTLYQEGKQSKTFKDVEALLLELDKINKTKIASSKHSIKPLDQILAAKGKKHRSAKEVVNDLIRVKSSNVWAYGVEPHNDNPAIGDIYVQFKGKNGGPGDVYKYYDVYVNLWRKFITAPSKGHFVWKYLRNKFLYSKLTGDRKGVSPNAIN